jgi:hypothetical protein
MSLSGAIGEIQALMEALTGIQGAPQYPPASINEFPFIVCYPETGIIKGSTPLGNITWLHNITLQLHVMRYDLVNNLDVVYDYVELIPHTIYNNLELFTALDTPGEITGELAVMRWNNVTTIGIDYTIGQVKIIEAEALPA